MVDVVCCKIMRSVSDYLFGFYMLFRTNSRLQTSILFGLVSKVESMTRNSQLLEEKKLKTLPSVGLRPPSLRFRQIASVKTALQNLNLAYTGLCQCGLIEVVVSVDCNMTTIISATTHFSSRASHIAAELLRQKSLAKNLLPSKQQTAPAILLPTNGFSTQQILMIRPLSCKEKLS